MAESSPAQSGNIFASYFRGVKLLKETRSEFWTMQLISLLDGIGYFAIVGIAVVILETDVGFTGEKAAMAWTAVSSAITLSFLLVGPITDWLGIRRSMLISMGGLLILRALAAVFAVGGALPLRGPVVIAALVLMAPLTAMFGTTSIAADKRYTTRRARPTCFFVAPLFLNLGAAAGGFVIDIVYLGLDLPRSHVFTAGVISAAVCLLIVYLFVRREDQLYGPDEEQPANAAEPRPNPVRIAGAVLKSSLFWRYMLFSLLLFGPLITFMSIALIFPKYWYRVIGPDAQIGLLAALNPAIVMVIALFLFPIVHRFNAYRMIVLGALLTVVPLSIMLIPAAGGRAYIASITFLVAMSVGEVLYGARIREYLATIAPVGQEGSYLGFSGIAPMPARFLFSWFAGYMLARWCAQPPADNPLLLREQLEAGEIGFWDSPSAMWLIIGAVAIISPLVVWLLRKWLTRGTHYAINGNHNR